MLKNLIKIGIIFRNERSTNFDFIKSDMIWHKPTQSFSSSDNFFKVLWNNALKDDTKRFMNSENLDHMKSLI